MIDMALFPRSSRLFYVLLVRLRLWHPPVVCLYIHRLGLKINLIKPLDQEAHHLGPGHRLLFTTSRDLYFDLTVLHIHACIPSSLA